MANTTCRKCNGSGYCAHFARIDAGRCWSCTGSANTSYTRAAEQSYDPEAATAAWDAMCEERRAARKARRTP